MKFDWKSPLQEIFKGGFERFTLRFRDDSPAEHLEQLYLLLGNISWPPQERWNELVVMNEYQLGKMLFSDYFSLPSDYSPSSPRNKNNHKNVSSNTVGEATRLTKSVRDWSLLCLVQICNLANSQNGTDAHAYVHDILFTSFITMVETDRAFVTGLCQGIINIDQPHHHHYHDSPENRRHHRTISSADKFATPLLDGDDFEQPQELERQSLLESYIRFAKVFLQAKYDSEFERSELNSLSTIVGEIFEIGCSSSNREAAKVLVALNWFYTLGIRNELTIPSLESQFVGLDVSELVGISRPSGGNVVPRSTNLIARSFIREISPVVASCAQNDRFTQYLCTSILFFLNALGAVNVDSIHGDTSTTTNTTTANDTGKKERPILLKSAESMRKRKTLMRSVSDREINDDNLPVISDIGAKDSILFEQSLRCVISLTLFPSQDLFFLNDYKLLLDLILRELANLAPQSFLRFSMLNVLLVLISRRTQYEASEKYRIRDIVNGLNDIIFLKGNETMPVIYRRLSAEILAKVEAIMENRSDEM
jgi:hypothetical protein